MRNRQVKPTKRQIKANRRKWALELRSGKWPQCRNDLHDGYGFCCLGVAAVAVCGIAPQRLNVGDPYGRVRAALGLTKDDGGPQDEDRFVDANDTDRKRFKTIAKMVDALPDPE